MNQINIENSNILNPSPTLNSYIVPNVLYKAQIKKYMQWKFRGGVKLVLPRFIDVALNNWTSNQGMGNSYLTTLWSVALASKFSTSYQIKRTSSSFIKVLENKRNHYSSIKIKINYKNKNSKEMIKWNISDNRLCFKLQCPRSGVVGGFAYFGSRFTTL